MKYLAIGHSMLFVLRICVQRCLSSHWNLIIFVLVCNSVEAAHYCINCLQIDYSISKLLFLCALTLLSTQTSQSFCWFKTFVHCAAQISHHHHFDFFSTIFIVIINIIITLTIHNSACCIIWFYVFVPWWVSVTRTSGSRTWWSWENKDCLYFRKIPITRIIVRRWLSFSSPDW